MHSVRFFNDQLKTPGYKTIKHIVHVDWCAKLYMYSCLLVLQCTIIFSVIWIKYFFVESQVVRYPKSAF
jgi:hypothetical protein